MGFMILIQAANPITQTVFIIAIELGRYFTIRDLRSQSQEMIQERSPGAGP